MKYLKILWNHDIVRWLYDFFCYDKILKKKASYVRKSWICLGFVGTAQHSVKVQRQELEAAAHTAFEPDTEHSSHSLLFIRLEIQTDWTGLSSLETFSQTNLEVCILRDPKPT